MFERQVPLERQPYGKKMQEIGPFSKVRFGVCFQIDALTMLWCYEAQSYLFS